MKSILNRNRPRAAATTLQPSLPSNGHDLEAHLDNVLNNVGAVASVRNTVINDRIAVLEAETTALRAVQDRVKAAQA